jgi:hypothetical protein|tara:strand:+ start:504 stop:2297 length:1794 start_codon:yes stop_codon:yes gene_type:complete
MAKKPISYTSRDFESIKASLTNYAKRYYSSTYQDFNEASFGALMLDLVSYVGDQLSFYVDYQANESFLETAIEYGNVVSLAKQLGYKPEGASTSTGTCSFYIMVPASTTTSGPDPAYIPMLASGATLSATGGAVFTLAESVDFTNQNNEITVARVNPDTGVPTWFAIKAYGSVSSGEQGQINITVRDYRRFLKLKVNVDNISEIISVVDSQGNVYYEVGHLSQDIILVPTINTGSDRDTVGSIMKLQPVPRRYVVEFDGTGDTFLQFGYGSEDNLTGDTIADPADVVLNTTGRNYVSDTTFDPTNLIKSDKFGVVPTDTILTIVYRSNSVETVNAPVGAITEVAASNIQFRDRSTLPGDTVQTIIGSLEVENEDPILGDTEDLETDEIKQRAYGSFSSQNRAVTKSDYINLSYRMPRKFGSVKRVNIIKDAQSASRNLNMYVLSSNVDGSLTKASEALKTNLKVWLDQYRMMSDTIDILDGKIINYGINFEVIADVDANRYSVLQACVKKLKDDFLNVKNEFGEPVYITDIYKHLNDVPGVVDTVKVELVNKSGGAYSPLHYRVNDNLSRDGRYLNIPEDAVAELLLPDQDILGVIK